jgi:hypothetical protein
LKVKAAFEFPRGEMAGGDTMGMKEVIEIAIGLGDVKIVDEDCELDNIVEG